MKSNEIRNLSPDEIAKEVTDRRQKILDLRFTSKVGQMSNVKEINAKKREIARLLTVANEQKRAQKGSQK
ncbi:MAG: 50S ribosomal protein L29 [Trueperaceae bacterium]